MISASPHVLLQILHHLLLLRQLASTPTAMMLQCFLALIAQSRHALRLARVRWTSAVHRSMPAWLTQLVLLPRTAHCSAIVVTTNAFQHVLQQIRHRSLWLRQLASTQIATAMSVRLELIVQLRRAQPLAFAPWTNAALRSMTVWLTPPVLLQRIAL